MEAAARPTKKDEQSTRSRERLVEAATRLFSERGYRDTSVQAIAEAAGISRGSIFWHFGSKDGLLSAVAEEAFRRWETETLVGDVGDARGLEAMRRALDSHKRFLRDDEDVLRLFFVLMFEALGPRPELAGRFAALHQGLRERGREWLEGGDLRPRRGCRDGGRAHHGRARRHRLPAPAGARRLGPRPRLRRPRARPGAGPGGGASIAFSSCRPSPSKRPARSGSRRSPTPSRPRPTRRWSASTAAGVCGSDLHILHGRHPVEPGFTIGHEFTGEVLAVGDGVTRVAPGDRVTGSLRHRVRPLLLLRPRPVPPLRRPADLRPREDLRRPPGRPGRAARRAPRRHDAAQRARRAGRRRRPVRRRRDEHRRTTPCARPASSPATASSCSGMGPSACAPCRPRSTPGASQVIAVDGVAERLEMAAAVRRHADPPDRAGPARRDQGAHRGPRRRRRRRGRRHARGARPGDPPDPPGREALRSSACTASRCEVHMGLLWNKSLTVTTGLANVLAHFDDVADLLAAGELDPSPLVDSAHAAGAGPRGLRGLRPPRGAEDRPDPLTGG